jgi:hypothetical protein
MAIEHRLESRSIGKPITCDRGVAVGTSLVFDDCGGAAMVVDGGITVNYF